MKAVFCYCWLNWRLNSTLCLYLTAVILTAGGGKLFVIGFGFKKEAERENTATAESDAAFDSFAVVSQPGPLFFSFRKWEWVKRWRTQSSEKKTDQQQQQQQQCLPLKGHHLNWAVCAMAGFKCKGEKMHRLLLPPLPLIMMISEWEKMKERKERKGKGKGKDEAILLKGSDISFSRK